MNLRCYTRTYRACLNLEINPDWAHVYRTEQNDMKDHMIEPYSFVFLTIVTM